MPCYLVNSGRWFSWVGRRRVLPASQDLAALPPSVPCSLWQLGEQVSRSPRCRPFYPNSQKPETPKHVLRSSAEVAQVVWH